VLQQSSSSIDLSLILNRRLTTDQILISAQVMNAGIVLLQKIVGFKSYPLQKTS